MYKVIALAGQKGAGKDTTANFIIDYAAKNHSIKVNKVAFADPIKKKIQHLFDLDPSSNEQYDLFKRDVISFSLPGYLSHLVSGRHIVREIGMLMRSYDEKQFIRYVKEKIEESPDDIWIVTDMRFENEYNMLKEDYAAKMIKIKRNNVGLVDNHITEKEFADYRIRYLIENYETEKELEITTVNIFQNILKEWE
jgi:hypothetical protein